MALGLVATQYPTWQDGVSALGRALNRLIGGEISVVGEVTLTASVATTDVKDQRAGEAKAITLHPTTANAAAALATTYIDPAEIGVGTFKIRHANNAQTDRTFRYVILG